MLKTNSPWTTKNRLTRNTVALPEGLGGRGNLKKMVCERAQHVVHEPRAVLVTPYPDTLELDGQRYVRVTGGRVELPLNGSISTTIHTCSRITIMVVAVGRHGQLHRFPTTTEVVRRNGRNRRLLPRRVFFEQGL
jgi:hypothetical protein